MSLSEDICGSNDFKYSIKWFRCKTNLNTFRIMVQILPLTYLFWTEMYQNLNSSAIELVRGRVLGQKAQPKSTFLTCHGEVLNKSIFCVSKLKTLRNMVGG